jgi:hypothetical protein
MYKYAVDVVSALDGIIYHGEADAWSEIFEKACKVAMNESIEAECEVAVVLEKRGEVFRNFTITSTEIRSKI